MTDSQTSIPVRARYAGCGLCHEIIEEMLTALNDLVTDDEGWRDRNRPEYQERLAAARAVIRRAEGASADHK